MSEMKDPRDMTDAELRQAEILRTDDDIIEKMLKIKEVICGSPKADKRIDDVMARLADALYEKEDYILENSIEYRKNRNWWGRMLDHWAAKRLRKVGRQTEKYDAEMEELRQRAELARAKNEVEALEAPAKLNIPRVPAPSPSPALSSTPPVDVLDQQQVKALTAGVEQETPQEGT